MSKTFSRIVVCIIAVFLAFLTAFETPMDKVKAVVNENKYISEVKAYSANSADEAKKWLTDNGYTVIDQNMRQNASDSKYIYMGYKTTNNPDEAITDIKMGAMNQGFESMTYRELADSISTQYAYVTQKVVKMAYNVQENADNDSYLAKTAIEMLNIYYYENGAENIPLFEFLTDPSTPNSSIQDILLLATDAVVSAIYTYLSMGCMDEGTNFLQSLSAAEPKYFFPSDSDEQSLTYYNNAQKLVRPLEEFYNNYTEAVEFSNTKMTQAVYDNYMKVLERRNNGESDEQIFADYTEEETALINDLENYSMYIGTYEQMKKYSLNITDCIFSNVHYSNVADYILACGNLRKNANGEVYQEDLKRIYALCQVLNETQTYAFEMSGVIMNVGFACSNDEDYYLKMMEQAKIIRQKIKNENLKDSLGREVDGFSVYYGTDPNILDKKMCLTSAASRANGAANLLKSLCDISGYYNSTETCLNVLKYAGAVGCVVFATTAILVGVGAMMSSLGLIAGTKLVVTLGFSVFSIGATAAASAAGGLATGFAVFSAFAAASIVLLIVAVAVIVIVAIVYGIMKAVRDSKRTTDTVQRTEMPQIVFDLVDNKFIKYEVLSNPDGTPIDFNAYSTKYWNIVCTSKSKEVGSPLLVNDGVCFITSNSNTIPDGYRALRKFGYVDAANVNENDTTSTQVYLFFKTYNSVNGLDDVTDKSGKYLSDLIVVSGTENVEVVAKLEKQGFQPIDYNLTPNTDDTDYSAYTIVGFKTTNNPNEAITDIRVLFGSCPNKVYYGYGSSPSGGESAATYTNCVDSTADVKKTLNGWALYYTKFRGVGLPILATSLTVSGSTDDVCNRYDIVPVSNFSDGAFVDLFNCCGMNPYNDDMIYKYDNDGYNHVFMYYQYAESFRPSTQYVSGIAFFSGYDTKDISMHNILSPQNYRYAPITKDLAIENNKYGGATYMLFTTTYNPYRAISDIMFFAGAIDSDGVQDFISVGSTSYAAAKVIFTYDIAKTDLGCNDVIGVRSSNSYATRQASEGAVYQTNLKDLEDEDLMRTQTYKWDAIRAMDVYVAGPGCGEPLKPSDVVLVWADDYNLNNSTVMDLGYGARDVNSVVNNADYRPVMDMRDALKDDSQFGANLLFDRSGLHWFIKIPTTCDKVTIDFYGIYLKRDKRARTSQQKYVKGVYANFTDSGQYSVDTTYLGMLAKYGFGEFIEQNIAASGNWRTSNSEYQDIWTTYQGRSALLMVQYTSNYNEAITDIALLRLNDDNDWKDDDAGNKSVSVDGMTYNLASNRIITSGYYMNNDLVKFNFAGNSYALYTTTNTYHREPITDIQLSTEPLVDGYATASTFIKKESVNEKGKTFYEYERLSAGDSINDSNYILFKRSATTDTEYYNHIYGTTGTSENDTRKKLYYNGCTEILGKFNDSSNTMVGICKTTNVNDPKIITDIYVGSGGGYSNNGTEYTCSSDSMGLSYIYTASVPDSLPLGKIQLVFNPIDRPGAVERMTYTKVIERGYNNYYCVVYTYPQTWLSNTFSSGNRFQYSSATQNSLDGTVLTIEQSGPMLDYGPSNYTTEVYLNHGLVKKAVTESYNVGAWYDYANKGVTEIIVKSFESIDDYAFFGFSGEGLTISISNPNCVIEEGAIPQGAKIKGCKGSTAEKYALEHDMEFEMYYDSCGVVLQDATKNIDVRWGVSNGTVYISGTGSTVNCSSITHKNIGNVTEAIVEDGVTVLAKNIIPDSVTKISFLGTCQIKKKAIPAKATVYAIKDSEMWTVLKEAGYNVLPYYENFGKAGDNITWYSDGTGLTFEGTGDMYPSSQMTDLAEYIYIYRAKIHSVKFDEGITSISDKLLSGANCIKDIAIPSTVTTLGNNCFEKMNLDSLIIGDSVTELPAGMLASSKVENLYLYSSNTKVNDNLCDDNTKITNIFTYEKSYLAEYAKAKGLAITSVGVATGKAGDNVKWEMVGGELKFTGSGPMTDAENFDYDTAYDWRYYAYQPTSVTIANGITTLANRCFMAKENLKSVVIPDSVTSIGEEAFFGCNLDTLTLGTGITNINGSLIANCSIGTLIIRNNNCTIENLGEYATVKQIVGYINSYAYRYAEDNGLTFVDIKTGLTMLPVEKNTVDGVTWYVKGYTLYFQGTGTITKAMQSGWASYAPIIKGVYIGYGIEAISSYAFSNLTSLVEINFERKSGKTSVTTLCDYALYGCSNLQSVTICAGTTYVGKYALGTSVRTLTVDSKACIFEYPSITRSTIVYCPNNSYALKYCMKNRISYKTLQTLGLAATILSETNIIVASALTIVLAGAAVGLIVYKRKKNTVVEEEKDK